MRVLQIPYVLINYLLSSDLKGLTFKQETHFKKTAHLKVNAPLATNLIENLI